MIDILHVYISPKSPNDFIFQSPDFHSYIQTLKNLGTENKKLYDRYITCLYFGAINNPLN